MRLPPPPPLTVSVTALFTGLAVATGQEWMATGHGNWGALTAFFVLVAAGSLIWQWVCVRRRRRSDMELRQAMLELCAYPETSEFTLATVQPLHRRWRRRRPQAVLDRFLDLFEMSTVCMQQRLAQRLDVRIKEVPLYEQVQVAQAHGIWTVEDYAVYLACLRLRNAILAEGTAVPSRKLKGRASQLEQLCWTVIGKSQS